MSIGWFVSLANADLYFTEERLETDIWDALSDAEKEKTIKYSYNRLYHSPQWNLPTYAEATATQRVVLRIINAEMANYIAEHISDEDHRKGLQAQNVIDAGIVKEKYDKEQLDKLPIPAHVIDLLEAFSAKIPFFATDIDRDEEESVTEDVTDLD